MNTVEKEALVKLHDRCKEGKIQLEKMNEERIKDEETYNPINLIRLMIDSDCEVVCLDNKMCRLTKNDITVTIVYEKKTDTDNDCFVITFPVIPSNSNMIYNIDNVEDIEMMKTVFDYLKLISEYKILNTLSIESIKNIFEQIQEKTKYIDTKVKIADTSFIDTEIKMSDTPVLDGDKNHSPIVDTEHPRVKKEDKNDTDTINTLDDAISKINYIVNITYNEGGDIIVCIDVKSEIIFAITIHAKNGSYECKIWNFGPNVIAKIDIAINSEEFVLIDTIVKIMKIIKDTTGGKWTLPKPNNYIYCVGDYKVEFVVNTLTLEIRMIDDSSKCQSPDIYCEDVPFNGLIKYLLSKINDKTSRLIDTSSDRNRKSKRSDSSIYSAYFR